MINTAKRFRRVLVSESRGCKVDGFIVARDQLQYLFEKASFTKYKEVLDPTDRQNVELVLKLYQLLKDAIALGESRIEKLPDGMLKAYGSSSFFCRCNTSSTRRR